MRADGAVSQHHAPPRFSSRVCAAAASLAQDEKGSMNRPMISTRQRCLAQRPVGERALSVVPSNRVCDSSERRLCFGSKSSWRRRRGKRESASFDSNSALLVRHLGQHTSTRHAHVCFCVSCCIPASALLDCVASHVSAGECGGRDAHLHVHVRI